MQKQQRDQNKGQKLETLIGIIKEAEQRRQALTPIQQPSSYVQFYWLTFINISSFV